MATTTNLIIRNARIFTPDGIIEGDLRCEDGRIAEIGRVSSASAQEVDIEGKWLWPGAIDAHAHIRDPGLVHKEDWSTGTAAAVAGGVTTIFDMPNTIPTTTTLDALAQKRALARAKARALSLIHI